jgi:hypothetical protein
MTTTTHPDVDQDPEGRPIRHAAGTSRWQKAIGILGLVVVLWASDRLFDVISSGGTTPSADHQPAGGTPTTQPAGSDDPAPGSDTESHDPSQFDHG